MNQYLVEVSAKSKPGGEFRQRMLPTYVSEQRLLQILQIHQLVSGTQLQYDDMTAFYSTEGIYPFCRLLVLEGPTEDCASTLADLLEPMFPQMSFPLPASSVPRSRSASA